MTWLSDKSHKKMRFEEIYEEYFDRVYRYAYMILLNQHDAEDITYETFIAEYNSYDRYDASKASVITWLSRIAHNKAVNFLNSSACRERNELPDMNNTGSEDKAIEKITDDVAFAALSFLSTEERELLTYRYVLDFSNNFIV